MLDYALQVEYFARGIAVCHGPLSRRLEWQQQVLKPLQELCYLRDMALECGLPAPPADAPFRSGIPNVSDWRQWEYGLKRAVKELPDVCQQMVDQIITVVPPFPENSGDEEQMRKFDQGQLRAHETFQQGRERLQAVRDRLLIFQSDMGSFPPPGLATAGQPTVTPAASLDPKPDPAEAGQQTPEPGLNKVKSANQPKRSTERGEGRVKIIAALTKHHQYDKGSCLCMEPIGVNELARLAEVSKATVSRFFNSAFNDCAQGGHARYRGVCHDSATLGHALKLLRGEFTPSILFKRLQNENRSEDTDE
jgi:hypothetical protein